jgi:hypothetical protein
MYKNILLLSVLAICALALACGKESTTECLDERLEQFKEDEWATKIVKFNHEEGAFYWLVKGGIADEGEPLLNENCEEVCKLDCFCSGNTPCDQTILDAPQEVIWSK